MESNISVNRVISNTWKLIKDPSRQEPIFVVVLKVLTA
jgi:hypothetical protein